MNDLRRSANLPLISWRYVEQRGEPRDTSLRELAVRLTLAWLQSPLGRRYSPVPKGSPDGDDEYHFLLGASVVILSHREHRVRC